MPLPDPLELTVPSAADDTPLSTRVYVPRPRDVQNASTSEHAPYPRAAVVAHPYAPLGGSFDDPVVLLTAEQLFDAGFVVLLFNFRRRTSWTSGPERKDYISVTRFLGHFVQLLTRTLRDGTTLLQLEFVLAGYSYGAMIASQTPPVQHLLDGRQDDGKMSRLAQHAAEIAASSGLIVNPLSPEELDPTKLAISTRYLLVSPVLPPTSTLLTFSLRALDYTHLKANDSLAVFGTKDHFTSGKRLKNWAMNLRINACAVEGVGHFWIEHGAAESLSSTIDLWAKR